MFKRFGIPALALATAMGVATPAMTLARDRDDDHRGGEFQRQESFRGHDSRDHDDYDHDRDRGWGFRDRDDRGWGFRDRGGFNFGVGIYGAPTPAPAAGYYDQYGNWHPYGYYDQFGVWHAY